MEIPGHWRLKAQRYRFKGAICPNCGQLMFPPRPVCPHCTARRARTAGEAVPVLLTSTDLTVIESHVRYQITESPIG
jgi:uncharacterized OB-fold protein